MSWLFASSGQSIQASASVLSMNKVKVKVAQSCPTLCNPYGLYSPRNSPGQNTGVGSPSLLQEIFPTQGPNPGLPQYRRIFYQLSHKGSPRILEGAAYPFCSRSLWPRNWPRVSCTAGGFFTHWALRQGLCLSGLTGLISSLSKGLSRVSLAQFKCINSSVLSLLYGPAVTSIHGYWKNHSLD